jgi:membrane protein YqaA with SNARE-associated domain
MAGNRVWNMPFMLLAYAFISNVALAVVPHEPVVIWYGAQIGVWSTAILATLGTVAAAWVDHQLFVPVIARVAAQPALAGGAFGKLRDVFTRAPFAIIAVSGVTPLPFFPFKAMAFAARYPLGRYLTAVAAGRLPRYLLLAWLGVLFQLPTWVFIALFVPFVLPSLLRMLPWRKRREN